MQKQTEIKIPKQKVTHITRHCDCRKKDPIEITLHPGLDPRFFVGTCRCGKVMHVMVKP